MLNNITLVGRLTSDCEVRATQSGKSVGHITLAVDRPKYNNETITDFINCVIWNCEKLAQYLTKGKPVAVVGSLQTRSYEDKNGNRRKAYEVKVDRLIFLPGGRGQKQDSIDEYEEVPFIEEELPF